MNHSSTSSFARMSSSLSIPVRFTMSNPFFTQSLATRSAHCLNTQLFLVKNVMKVFGNAGVLNCVPYSFSVLCALSVKVTLLSYRLLNAVFFSMYRFLSLSLVTMKLSGDMSSRCVGSMSSMYSTVGSTSSSSGISSLMWFFTSQINSLLSIYNVTVLPQV